MSEHTHDSEELIRRRALCIEPSDSRGWFEGVRFVCLDPVVELEDVDIESAATLLRAAFDGEDGAAVAACVRYDGSASVRVYDRVMRESLGSCVPPASTGPLVAEPRTTMDADAYVAAVESAQERIRAGGVYVLNLTHAVEGRPLLGMLETYRELVARASSRMNALWADEEESLLSVSPERFLAVRRMHDGTLLATIEPIKGTRPRGGDAEEDARLESELWACEKERAEHVMVVDMERNDLGRVAVPGGVRVDPLLEVFSTPYCHQLVSRVHARLMPGVSFAALLDATFPCGSVTGAPKIAAQAIIDEFETRPRGAYTGSLVVARPGRLDSSVLIRTLEYRSDRARWGTGSGVTVDSDAVQEWRETLLKASPVLGSDNDGTARDR